MNLKDGIKRNCSGFMKEEIIKDFISVNEKSNDTTAGKYLTDNTQNAKKLDCR